MTDSPTSDHATGHDAPLVVHIIGEFGIGGMENGIVNIINQTPPGRYRHAIVGLKSSVAMKERLTDPDVRVVALGKGLGKGFGIYTQVYRLLRQWKPAIVHTRNLPTIDMVVPAVLAGVRHRVHGEHGRDMVELAGGNRKYNLIRRAVSPLVQQYIAVSKDIAGWLHDVVGVPERKIRQIYNGVDIERFHPAAPSRAAIPDGPGADFAPEEAVVFGTVGRMATVKDQLSLARAFVQLVTNNPEARNKARLVMVGEGPLRSEARAVLADAHVSELAWLPGARADIPEHLRALDVFVLPSLNEGISNTILEAMATGLPVIATEVGGNPELLTPETGRLVPKADPSALARAMKDYLDSPALLRAHGAAGRRRAEDAFSLAVMTEQYLSVYDRLLGR
ncbi:MAG TPA: TIGR03088 family PEP-CTERM/XrtA system glycosyltransferase [Alphaproteobacteria bacterium]|nr:TIGR03088 family PEP-CTERM/XrtA system glycosyltransferase [Alphaproteobacteria bacterium]